jgi:hypothetical protein
VNHMRDLDARGVKTEPRHADAPGT